MTTEIEICTQLPDFTDTNQKGSEGIVGSETNLQRPHPTINRTPRIYGKLVPEPPGRLSDVLSPGSLELCWWQRGRGQISIRWVVKMLWLIGACVSMCVCMCVWALKSCSSKPLLYSTPDKSTLEELRSRTGWSQAFPHGWKYKSTT